MRSLFLSTIAAVIGVISGGSAWCEGRTELVKEYECVQNVSPAKVVAHLIEKGALQSKAFGGQDSESYFAANEGFTVFGLDLVEVQGFEPNQAVFERLPGTAPPTNFALVVRASEKRLIKAMARHGINVTENTTPNTYPKITVAGKANLALPPGANKKAEYAVVTCESRP